jgi:hypothetical protein
MELFVVHIVHKEITMSCTAHPVILLLYYYPKSVEFNRAKYELTNKEQKTSISYEYTHVLQKKFQNK